MGVNSDFSKESIEWCEDEPVSDLRFRPIMSPKPHVNINFILTSNDYVGVFTHYYDRRTHPCTGERSLCEGCGRRVSKRWKGYLAGLLIPGGREVLIELTTNALDGCPQLRELRGRLRGLKLTLSRRGDSRNGPVVAQLGEIKGVGQLPAAFDIRNALCRVWGVAGNGGLD